MISLNSFGKDFIDKALSAIINKIVTDEWNCRYIAICDGISFGQRWFITLSYIHKLSITP